MAARHPIRIFFGTFTPFDLGARGAVIADQTDDRAFANFLTGRMVGASTTLAMHTRRPSGSLGSITAWDEYIDLNQAAVEPTDANDLLLFRNIAGIESVLVWADAAANQNIPVNMYTLGTIANEFFHPTRRLSLPYPAVDVPPPVVAWVFPDNDIPSTPTGYGRLYVTLQTGGDESSPCNGIDIPIDTGSPATYKLRIYNNHPTLACTYTIWRAPIDNSIHDRSKQLTDFAQAITGHYQTGSIAAGGYSDISGLLGTLGLTGTHMTEPALNDAVARVAFNYRRRSNQSLQGQLKNQILVLNSGNHMYYKAIIGACSPMFSEGVAARTEETVQLVLQVIEQGSWSNEAWELPNGDTTLLASGTGTGASAFALIDTVGGDFVNDGVLTGDTIINVTQGWSATVTVDPLAPGQVVYHTYKNGVLWLPGDVYEIYTTGDQYLHMHSRSMIDL